MNEHRAPPARDNIPVWFLAAAVLATCLVLSCIGWNTIAAFSMYRTAWERHSRIQQLQVSILNLDEVLTMSARMAAATGSPVWELRYRKYEPVLDSAIKQVMTLEPDAYRGEGASQTDAANLKLVALEHRAFDLVRQNRRAEAHDLLSSREYEAQKRIYSLGITAMADGLRKNAAEMLRLQQRKAVINIFAVGASLLIVLIGWLVVLRMMQRWRTCLAESNRSLNEQATALRELNGNLDRRVEERTADKLEMETLDFDLSNLLDDFAAALAVRTQEKGIELLCAADPAVPTQLRGDPGRLRQILANLAGNAVKFTHAGEVAVRVSLVEEKENDVLLRFSVRDTGMGIPKDKIGLLFEKFSQVDTSTTRAHAESRPPADLRDVRALIVDDNATNREILTTRMTSWGMRPSEVEDSPGALQALYRALDEHDPFRIAVIDMQMPGMNGEVLARTIKADKRLVGTRMVMLTSLGSRGDAQRCEKIGFAAYTTKPIRHQELFSVLSTVLSDIPGSVPRPIVTRHSAHEQWQPFAGVKARILLAEDNITNQLVALGILKKLGLPADAVASGREALKVLETVPYDLVLMDVQMPVMDGIEATRQIRNPQSAVPNHGIPIIAMTAHAIQGDRERCIEAGMNGYVSKPVSPQALTEVLARWLPKKNDESGLSAEETPPPVLHPLSPVVFDRAGMLNRLMNDEDLARVVTESFLDDIPRQIEALRRYLKAWDAPGVERQTHTLRGASSNVGGEALSALAFEMERAGKSGDLASVRARMDDLEHGFVRLKEAMKREL